jgi:hypothetical protein
LGYRVSWNPRLHEVQITDAQTEVSISINRNAYRANGLTRSLEVAPTLEISPSSGITATYVPLSFFDQILDAVYSEDESGNITFSIYRP